MTVLRSSNNDSAGLAGSWVIRRPLLWLNLLCLDAPLVALTWQLAFAHTFRTGLQPAESIALFLTAWWIYLADRFVDSIALSSLGRWTARAQFCLHYRKPWAVAILLVAVVDGAVIYAAVPHRTIIRGMVFGMAALAYLAVNFVFSKWWRTLPIKELIIGFVFAAGTVLVPGAPSWTETFLVAAVLFGSTCWLNCLSIAVWERDFDQDQKRHSFATDRSGAEIYVRVFGIALVCAVAAFGFYHPALRSLAVCLLLSSLLLLLLPYLPVSRDERTAAADLVLLTPILLSLFERML